MLVVGCMALHGKSANCNFPALLPWPSLLSLALLGSNASLFLLEEEVLLPVLEFFKYQTRHSRVYSLGTSRCDFGLAGHADALGVSDFCSESHILVFFP